MSYALGHNVRYEHPLKTEIYKRGYTITSFADKVGISRFTLTDAFTGRHKLRGDTMSWIAEALNEPYEEVERLCQSR